ncbi:MAG: DNA-packaging protein, partial [Candidatus Limnocylindrales bacterium]
MRPDRLSRDDWMRFLALTEVEYEATRALSAPKPWSELARPEQLPPPGDWRTWLILAGRGWGKTRTGAETIVGWVREGSARRIAVVAATLADVRDLSMRVLREVAGAEVEYLESKHFLVRWPNGAEAMGFSAEDPDSLRGYQFTAAWCDELAAWHRPEAWDQLQFGLRDPGARQIVTTTPRPVRLVRELLADPTTVVTRGRTVDNAANLDAATLRFLWGRYGGTRQGRQELDSEVLDDIPGALWTRDRLDALRVAAAPELVRIVVAIDPAVTSSEDADETGIVVAGKGADGQGYLLADLSGRYSPDGWARCAVGAYRTWQADRIVGEANQGGDMVEATLRTVDPAVSYKAVHATRDKHTRAEPVAALYEQGRIHHVGAFPALEDQLCAALPEGGGGPDDRLDALVWALTELGLTLVEWDIWTEAFARDLWPCHGCGQLFGWDPRRPCPRCWLAAPETSDGPAP